MAFVPFFTLTSFTHTHSHSTHNVTTLANITSTVYSVYTFLSFSLLPSLVHFCQCMLCSFCQILPLFVECIMLTLTLNKVQLVHHVKKFICSSVNSTSAQFLLPDFFILLLDNSFYADKCMISQRGVFYFEILHS